MVGSLAHLMPLAMVSIIAYLVVDALHGRPVYTAMFENFIGLRAEKEPLHQETLSVTIYPGSELDGCQIADYSWPADCIVSLIYRGEDKIIPNGKTVLLAGDTLLIQANISDKNKLQEILERSSHAPKM